MAKFNEDFFNMLEKANDLAPKTRDEYIRAPFGWPGGKSRSLPHLLKFIPVRDTWIEVCGGSGVLSLNRPKSTLEIFNDRYAGVVAFYRCIRDTTKCQAMVDRLTYCLHSREEFVWCRDTWDTCWDDIERAARWYYMVKMSFTQLGRNWGRATHGLPQQARAFQNSLLEFSVIHEVFKRFQIENLDAITCIRDYDSDNTVFYVDPDYIGTDPGIYKHRVEHEKLLDVIQESRGFFAVSAYKNELYDSYKWDDIQQWEVSITANAQAFEIGHLKGKENVMTRDKKAIETLYIKESK